jgi:hypothetical protein
MANKKSFSGIPAIALVFVFGLVLAGCASAPKEGPAADLNAVAAEPSVAEQLAADINAIEAGKATVSGDTITLIGWAGLKTSLTVPAGVTLDLTTDGAALELQDGAVLTVNGTVNAKSQGINIDSVVANPAIINGSGTIHLKSKGRLLDIDNGKKLILDGVTLVGLADNDNSLVGVHNDSEFVLKSGAITDNIRNNDDDGGGGVITYGTFTMGGGTISDNSTQGNGGGVLVYWGTFIMEGGTISGNSSFRGGGGVGVRGGTFIFEGGAIYGASAEDGKANTSSRDNGKSLAVWLSGVAKWGTGGTYTIGGIPQTGGSDIMLNDGNSNDTLIAAP